MANVEKFINSSIFFIVLYTYLPFVLFFIDVISNGIIWWVKILVIVFEYLVLFIKLLIEILIYFYTCVITCLWVYIGLLCVINIVSYYMGDVELKNQLSLDGIKYIIYTNINNTLNDFVRKN